MESPGSETQGIKRINCESAWGSHRVSLNSEAPQKKTLTHTEVDSRVRCPHSGVSDGISGTFHIKRGVQITRTAMQSTDIAPSIQMGDSPFFQLDKTTSENKIRRAVKTPIWIAVLVYVWVTITKERFMLRLNIYDMSGL